MILAAIWQMFRKMNQLELEGTISHCVVHSEVHSYLWRHSCWPQQPCDKMKQTYLVLVSPPMHFLELSLTMGGGENPLLNEPMAVRQVAVKPDK